MKWVEHTSSANVKAIGAVEVLGAAGLLLPALTGIMPILTPVSSGWLGADYDRRGLHEHSQQGIRAHHRKRAVFGVSGFCGVWAFCAGPAVI